MKRLTFLSILFFILIISTVCVGQTAHPTGETHRQHIPVRIENSFRVAEALMAQHCRLKAIELFDIDKKPNVKRRITG